MADFLKEEILSVFEQYLGYKFPETYRKYLKKYNGGELQKRIFLFKGEKVNGSSLDRLFGFIPDKYKNILLYYKDYKDRIPSNTFPIGYDPFGNLILLSVKGSDRGKVYFWDHEEEADPHQGEEPSYSNLTLIADSFDEFINNLKQ